MDIPLRNPAVSLFLKTVCNWWTHCTYLCTVLRSFLWIFAFHPPTLYHPSHVLLGFRIHYGLSLITACGLSVTAGNCCLNFIDIDRRH